MFSTLPAEATKNVGVIDRDKVLTYLTPFWAPLCTADENGRKTKKNDLFFVLEDMEIDAKEAHGKCNTYMVIVLAYGQSVITERKSVRDLAAKLLNSMPSTYDTVYVVCDRYGEASINSVECQTCGYGEKCIF